MTVTEQLAVAELIYKIRSYLGLSQEKFASQLGVTSLTVNRWENRRTKPSPLAMEKIKAQLQDMGEQGRDLLVKYFQIEVL